MSVHEDRNNFIYQPPPSRRGGQETGLSIVVTIASLILAFMAVDHATYAALESFRDWLPFLD
jgi:hypothetical protein